MTGELRARDATGGIRVLLVDDHSLVRRALAEVLADEDDLTVVGECEDGSEVVEAAGRLRPDIVLMDVSMPGVDGLAATRALRSARPEARVVVLTGEDPGVRPEAVLAGASALVPKRIRVGALLRCLRTVAADGTGCPYCL